MLSPPTVAVLVPYRPDGAERDRAWAWLAERWNRVHPNWSVHTSDAASDGWSKGAAIAAAAELAPLVNIALVVDADVWCDEWELAVEAVATGAPWAIPHKRVHRLTAAGTDAVIASGSWPPQPWVRNDLIWDVYAGVHGGGAVALPMATLRACPPDPRFVGWGQEDMAWSHALSTTAGRPWCGFSPLWHLWHEPQPRMTRGIGSDEAYALYQRYKREITPDGIARIVAEHAGMAGSLRADG